MNQIFKNKRFIFALTFFILINISFIVNVNALTDDNGNEIKCILDGTGLEHLADVDYCLTYNQEIKNKKYALYSYIDGSYEYKHYYPINIKKIIFDIREYNVGYDYLIAITDKYTFRTGLTVYRDFENMKIKTNNNKLEEIIINAPQLKYDAVGEEIEKFAGSSATEYFITKGTSFLIKNNKIEKYNYQNDVRMLFNTYKRVRVDNILYSDFNIYESSGTTIIRPKDEIKKPIEEQIEIVKGEIGKNIKFQYNNLKENYLVDIKRKDVETKKNLEWKTNPIRPNITFSTIEFENLTDSYIFERTIYDENKNIIFQKEEIISFGGLFDDINENSGVSDYFGFIKIFLKKASAIISPIFAIFNYFFNNIDPFMQLGIFCSFIILIIYFIMRGVRK